MKRKLAVPVLSTAIAGVFLFLFQVDTATGDDWARDPGVRGGDAGASLTGTDRPTWR